MGSSDLSKRILFCMFDFVKDATRPSLDFISRRSLVGTQECLGQLPFTATGYKEGNFLLAERMKEPTERRAAW